MYKCITILLMSCLMISCSSNKTKPDLIPYETNTVALFESEGVYYRIHPDQSCSTEMVVKAIVNKERVRLSEVDAEFISEAADNVAEYCDDLADKEVESIQFFFFEGNAKTSFHKATLTEGVWGWNTVFKNLGDDSVFDDLSASDRKAGKISPGLSRGYSLDLNSRACKAYSNWFSEFPAYGVSPYRVSSLLDKPIQDRVEKEADVDGFPVVLKHAVDEYYQFPPDLVSEPVFSKYFKTDFLSLRESEKNNFVRGAKQCFKLKELAAGKVEIEPFATDARSRVTSKYIGCGVLSRWIDSLPRNERYNQNTNYRKSHYKSAPFYQSYMFAEPYFNQVFYGRYISLSLDQRLNLAQSLSHYCSVKNKNSKIYRKLKDHTAYDFHNYRNFKNAVERGLSFLAQWTRSGEWKHLDVENRRFTFISATIFKWENLLSLISKLEMAKGHEDPLPPGTLINALSLKNEETLKIKQMYSVKVNFLGGEIGERFEQAVKDYLLTAPIEIIESEIQFLNNQLTGIAQEVETLTGFGAADSRLRNRVLEHVQVYEDLSQWLSNHVREPF